MHACCKRLEWTRLEVTLDPLQFADIFPEYIADKGVHRPSLHEAWRLQEGV